MRKNSKWTGLPTLALALGAVAWSASAMADPVITYSTAGQIDPSTGVTGPGVISFIPITDNSGATTSSSGTQLSNTFDAPSNFSLGYFQVAALPAGQTTTYNNTPFSITLNVASVNGTTPDPNATPIVFTGVLNGTVTGTDVSGVTASFNPPTNTPAAGANSVSTTPTQITDTFQTGLYSNTMTVPNTPFLIVPSTSNFGRTTVEANLSSQLIPPQPAGSGGGGTVGQTPEPTSMALFALALGGLALHRYRNRRPA